MNAKNMVSDLSPKDQADLVRMATSLGIYVPTVRETLNEKTYQTFADGFQLDERLSTLVGRKVRAF